MSTAVTVRRASFLEREPSRFVGRAVELADLDRRGDEHRLLTVCGRSGVGKTRLALRHAIDRRALYQSAGGVWFCDLSAAWDVDEMADAVLRTLGVSDQAGAQGDDALAAVGRALAARRRCLLVLDNLEQLLPDAAHAVTAWLDAAPEARLLVTSKVPLGIAGEELLELAPLRLPRIGTSGAEAVELFVDRVRAMRGRYTPHADELATIAELVRHLEGMPLAIEVAASRLQGTGMVALLPARPLSSRRPMDWAWALLEPWEREALSQCAVFRGGFDREAAEAVMRSAGPMSGPSRDVAGRLEALRRKALLKVDARPGAGDPLRFGMCESFRHHAREMLDLSGEATAVEWRHAAHFLELAAKPGRLAACDRANLEAAMELGAAASRPDLVLRGAVALDALSPCGLSRSQLARLDAALATAQVQGPELVGRALGVRAGALRSLGRMEEAARDAETALLLAEERGDRAHAAAMHVATGAARFQLGDLAAALSHSERALAMQRKAGDRGGEAATLQQIGAVHQSLGNTARARAHYEGALQLSVELEDGHAEARASMGLGSYHLEVGDLDRSLAYYERALLLAQRLDLPRSLRIVRGYMGILHFDADLHAEAERYLSSAASASKAAGDVRVEGIFLGIRGAVLAAQGELEEAREALDAAASLLRNHRFFHQVIEIHRGHLDLGEARRALEAGDLALATEHVLAARQRCVTARTPSSDLPDAPGALANRSDDARIALRILTRAIQALG